jgi:hypothetical protein
MVASCFAAALLGLMAFWFIKPWFLRRQERMLEPFRSHITPRIRNSRGTAFPAGLTRQEQVSAVTAAFSLQISRYLDDMPYQLEDVLDASNADGVRHELLRNLAAGSNVGVAACCALLWHSLHRALPEAKE